MQRNSVPIWMQSLIPTLMNEGSRGVLDTSVLLDHDIIAAERLPDESAITAVTLAELAAGSHATENTDSAAGNKWAASCALQASPQLVPPGRA